jgi:hypothetical protein
MPVGREVREREYFADEKRRREERGGVGKRE